MLLVCGINYAPVNGQFLLGELSHLTGKLKGVKFCILYTHGLLVPLIISTPWIRHYCLSKISLKIKHVLFPQHCYNTKDLLQRQKSILLVARRATYVVDGRFFSHFFFGRWRGAARIHVSHVQLTCVACSSHVENYYMVEGSPHVWQLMCTLLLYGGGEPSHVAHVCHVWQLTCTLLLYGGGEPSCVANVCHMCQVWQLTCTLLLYGGGEPSRVAHMCHVWQLTCMLLLYGGGEPSCVGHVHGN